MSRTPLVALATLSACAGLAATASARPAATCQLSAAGTQWIVVTRGGMSCAQATRVAQSFAARTASAPKGTMRTGLSTPLLPGYTCLIRNTIAPSGACMKGGSIVSWAGIPTR